MFPHSHQHRYNHFVVMQFHSFDIRFEANAGFRARS